MVGASVIESHKRYDKESKAQWTAQTAVLSVFVSYPYAVKTPTRPIIPQVLLLVPSILYGESLDYAALHAIETQRPIYNRGRHDPQSEPGAYSNDRYPSSL